MKMNRRSWVKGAGLLGTGFLSRVDKVAAAQKTPNLRDMLRAQATGASEKLFVKPTPGEEGPPAPTTADRLTLDWNKATVKRFKDTLAARDIQAFVVRDPMNIMYLTGYWHTTTERPQATFMNKDDADPWFMYPGLDRDSVTTWWFGSGRMYFDFLHGEGAVVGLTTAATVWVVAAVGTAVGAGAFIDATGGTALIMLVLVGLRPFEQRLAAKRRRVRATLRVKPGSSFDDFEPLILANGVHVFSRKTFEHDTDRTFELELIGATKQFDILCDRLRTEKDVISITTE